MKPPTFFLSSTIYDFKDLRSAIKYYLQQQGCRVLASDENDFPKPLDMHSYDACLKSIAEADFFVLLIGARVGGWYDETQRISITQREYREAYTLHQQGRLKILSFVRSDVWQMREERKSLGKHLRDVALDDTTKSQILNHQSKIVDDPEFTIRFIEEVGKNRETGAAAKGTGSFPTGNWLHQFDSFRDIIEQLQVQAFNGLPVEEAALRRLLRQDLMELLRVSLLKVDHDQLIDPATLMERLSQGIHGSLDLNDGIQRLVSEVSSGTRGPTDFEETVDAIAVNRDDLFNMFRFASNLAGKLFLPRILPEAIKSSSFLRFDQATGTMTELPVHRALLQLLHELELFGKINKTPMINKFMNYMDELTNTKADRPSTVRASKLHIGSAMTLLQRWVNVTKLCKAIILHLDGAPFSMPKLQGNWPKEDESRFEASAKEAEWYLSLPSN